MVIVGGDCGSGCGGWCGDCGGYVEMIIIFITES